MPKNPVNVGGSIPCFTMYIGVSASLPAGSVSIYSYNGTLHVDKHINVMLSYFVVLCSIFTLIDPQKQKGAIVVVIV